MTPSLGMYNLNMYGNSWTGLLQQGMGMLGGGFGGSGIFTNCFGEVNYDAMAGYGVANALLGVAGQAIASNIKAKEPEINYTQEIRNIDKEISSKLEQQADLNSEISTKNDEINTANNTINDLNKQITDLDVTGKKKAWEEAAAQTPKPDNVDDLEKVYKQAKEDAEKLAQKMMKGSFNLEDMLAQLRQIQKIGSLGGIMGMLPGLSKFSSQIEAAGGDKLIKKQEAIILSMTAKERRSPDIIKASRKKRIAAGAGVEVHEVNKLLKSYEQMSAMMKQMGKLGGMSKLLGSPLLKKSPFGGMPFGGMGGKLPF